MSSRRPLTISASLLFIVVWSGSVFAQGTDSFQIKVPRKLVAGQLPISGLKVTLSLASQPSPATPVTFALTDPAGVARTIGPFNPSYAGAGLPEEVFPAPAPTLGQDEVNVDAPEAPPGDTGLRRYTLSFALLSDYDLDTCANTMSTPDETWTVGVTPGSPLITGVCLLSFETPDCFGAQALVPMTEPVATLIINGMELPPAQNCEEERPAVDVALVLDKSGSMSSSASGASATKIDSLRAAVVDFVDVWQLLRSQEPGAPADDNLGVVFFDGDAHWMNDVGIPNWAGISDGLHPFHTIRTALLGSPGGATPGPAINAVAAGGSTSLGDGLLEASNKLFDGPLAANGHRKVILVMSNGKENTTQRVKVNDPLAPTLVQTYPTGNPAAAVPLPNQAGLQIYSVTVGSGTAVSADINEDIATATGGFYINSEDDASLLRPFFVELLQNFIKFNTWETVAITSETTSDANPYSTPFPLTSSTRSLAVSVMWDREFGPLRLVVQPPGAAAPLVQQSDKGSLRAGLNLPLKDPIDVLQDWRIEVAPVHGGRERPIPFHLVVLADDVGLKSDLSVLPADYGPGDAIQLRVRVKEFGKQVLGIGTDRADIIRVRLVKPGVTIGDLLSKSEASTRQPHPSDPLSAADAKLANLLQAHPDQLVRTDDTVILRDDGLPASGDEVAGDGIYSGTYQAVESGHYDFLFEVLGRGQRSGRFQRQQVKTVHVRPLPDPGLTQVSTDVIQTPNGGTLIIKVDPRTRFRHRLGPGWANYFWLSPGPHEPLFKPLKMVDLGDGTYTAGLSFVGDTPPAVSLHFLRVSGVIDDEVQLGSLPVKLQKESILITQLPGTGNQNLPPDPGTLAPGKVSYKRGRYAFPVSTPRVDTLHVTFDAKVRTTSLGVFAESITRGDTVLLSGVLPRQQREVRVEFESDGDFKIKSWHWSFRDAQVGPTNLGPPEGN